MKLCVCPSETENSFKAPKITESDEEEANEEGALIDVEASDDEDIYTD